MDPELLNDEDYETDTIIRRKKPQKAEDELTDSGTRRNSFRSPLSSFDDRPSPNLLSPSFDLSMLSPSPTFFPLHDPRFDFLPISEEDDERWQKEDYFRTGRITKGVSYNIMTGKLMADEHEKIEIVEKKNEADLTSETEKSTSSGYKSTKDLENEIMSFSDVFSAIPRAFNYADSLPEVNGAWVLKHREEELDQLTTFELQAPICAALNSRHYLLMFFGIDERDRVTGCELSARDRVCFRMALSRAVAGEFQPPLINAAPATLHGMNRADDLAAVTSTVDVVFLPILPVTSSDEPTTRRYVIVVRVKEKTEKVYQLSSGRIYIEENGVPVQLSCLEEASRMILGDRIIPELCEPIVVEDFVKEVEAEPEEAKEKVVAVKMPRRNILRDLNVLRVKRLAETMKEKLPKGGVLRYAMCAAIGSAAAICGHKIVRKYL
ncbi:unnamed protein product [Caenorhabditis auriculariae]|uniref:Uncharacterized protein n=1 Tax=Caenorhabditis auriculariae TaxID=2777116 RepID=A0A8S1HK17_9PELO|nr:unnamed protein product [Caenorhabditis auriculariae]